MERPATPRSGSEKAKPTPKTRTARTAPERADGGHVRVLDRGRGASRAAATESEAEAAEAAAAQPQAPPRRERSGGGGRTTAPPPGTQTDRGPQRKDSEIFGQPSGRRATAGRVLAVGLICFGLWTLFNANELYHNALNAPLGTRRTVSVDILRPISAFTNAIGLSGPVNAANTALGRHQTQTSGTLPPPPNFPGTPGTSPTGIGPNGLAPRPHTSPGHVVTPPPARVWPPAIVPPTPAHPLVMLDIGDSIGEDLGFGLGDLFSGDSDVKVIQKGVESTGLVSTENINWPVALGQYLHQYHPKAVVIMMGANDDQGILTPQNTAASPLSTEWDQLYSQRIAYLIDESVAAGAHVFWVGLPPLQDSAVNSSFALGVNALAQQQVAAHPSGATYFASWPVLAGPHGTFVQYKTINGQVEQIRYSDGIHLAPAGWDLLAHSMLQPMQAAWHVNLHAGS